VKAGRGLLPKVFGRVKDTESKARDQIYFTDFRIISKKVKVKISLLQVTEAHRVARS
jgi:hypothetical protein